MGEGGERLRQRDGHVGEIFTGSLFLFLLRLLQQIPGHI